MTKRLRWMALGVLAGAGGARWAERRLRRRVERYLPSQVRAEVASRVRAAGNDLRGALEEGREAMSEREAELRARMRLAPGPPGPAGGDSDAGDIDGGDRDAGDSDGGDRDAGDGGPGSGGDGDGDGEGGGGAPRGPVRPAPRVRLRLVGGRPGDPRRGEPR